MSVNTTETVEKTNLDEARECTCNLDGEWPAGKRTSWSMNVKGVSAIKMLISRPLK